VPNNWTRVLNDTQVDIKTASKAEQVEQIRLILTKATTTEFKDQFIDATSKYTNANYV